MKNSIKFYRLRWGCGYQKLAEIAGLGDDRAIRFLETGKTRSLRIDTALKISLALRTPVEKLFFLDPKDEVDIIQRRDAYTPGKRKRKRYEKPKPPKSKDVDTDMSLDVSAVSKSPRADLTPTSAGYNSSSPGPY